MSKVQSFSLTVKNDSDQNLFFTLFSYNKKTPKLTRALDESKTISQGTNGVFQWPVNIKASYDPNQVFYIAASEKVPILGVDVQTTIAALTIALDSRNETLRVKTVKYSEFEDLSKSRFRFHCTSIEASSTMRKMQKNTATKLTPNNPLRGVMNRDLKWTYRSNHQFLKVMFAQGQCTPRVCNAVKRLIALWMVHVPFKVEYLQERPATIERPEGFYNYNDVPYGADIIIGFDGHHPEGPCWSKTGIQSRDATENNLISMNIAFCNDRTLEKKPEIFNHAVLHEFGHALGLEHEHQSPVQGGLCINIAKVMTIKKTNGKYMTEDEARHDCGMLDSNDVTTSKVYDEYSIMNYGIPLSAQYDPTDPADGTQPDGTPWPAPREIVETNELSEGDKEFISQMYY